MGRKKTGRVERWAEGILWFACGGIVTWTLANLRDQGETNAGALALAVVLGGGLIGLSTLWARRRADDDAPLAEVGSEEPARSEEHNALAEVERVLAVTAHEMRGPLTAIIGANTTLRAQHDRLTETQQATLMNMTLRQARHLAMLVEDLLVSAEIDSTGVKLRPEWTDLESVVERAVESAESKRSAHHLDVTIEPVRCNIDASRTVQIIRNLVENAYKYTPEGSTVRVDVKMIDRNLVLQVADDGHGIPDGEIENLFDAYRRGDAGKARGNDGIGIGLHVVRRLADAMGGGVALVSSDQGTTFTVTIPCEVMSDKNPRVDLAANDQIVRRSTMATLRW